MNAPGKPIIARYVGYTKGTENHGDETLLWLIRDLLSPEIKVVTRGDEPFDIALLGGGTLINQSPWLIDYFQTFLDRSSTGRGLVFGTGVGDLAFWGNHFERWQPLLSRCDLIGVRGPHSLALLDEHGIANAEWIGDPYLCLHPPIVREFIPRQLGVNLGGTNNSLWGTDDQDFLRFMTDALKQLRSAGWSFVWISMWSQDLPLLNAVREEVDPESPPVLDARMQPFECYSALAGCELFIGEKLHACAMAAVAEVPFISLEYQPKVRDFASSLNMEKWTVSTASRDMKEIIECVNALTETRDSVQSELRQIVQTIRQNQASFLRRVKTHPPYFSS